MSEQNIIWNVEDRVATIILNRPNVLNAINQPMAEVLVQIIQKCMDNRNIRSVILTGAGRGFCAGGDMKAAWEYIQDGGDPRHFFRDLTVPLHRLITDIRLLEKPIIAAINGATGGAGVSLAAACDLRIAAENAKFKQAYTSIGLVPDGGWTAIVPQIIGPAKTAELLLLDPVLDAQKALDLGLVHEVVSDDKLMERAQEIAIDLAHGSATAFGGAKVLVNSALFPELEVQLERERQRIIVQGGTADFREGVSAFVEKRKPHFR